MLVRGERRYANAMRMRSGSLWNAYFDEDVDPRVDVVALRYRSCFKYQGDWYAFLPGCFDDSLEDGVGLWIDHQEATCQATTKSGLNIVSDDDSLRLSIDLDKVRQPTVVSGILRSESRSAASIGCTILASEDHIIDGLDVRIVSRARLNEVSLVRQGSHQHAFATLVDNNSTPPPRTNEMSATLQGAAALHKIKLAITTMKQSLQYGEKTPTANYTLSQLNHFQTEQTEQLQKLARTPLCLPEVGGCRRPGRWGNRTGAGVKLFRATPRIL